MGIRRNLEMGISLEADQRPVPPHDQFRQSLSLGYLTLTHAPHLLMDLDAFLKKVSLSK